MWDLRHDSMANAHNSAAAFFAAASYLGCWGDVIVACTADLRRVVLQLTAAPAKQRCWRSCHLGVVTLNVACH
jgi:hypothetical protein